MKKQLVIALSAIAAAIVMTGCAGVGCQNGAVAPVFMGPNFYSDFSGNSVIHETTESYTVIKRNVKARATFTSYFSCVTIGDVSYEKLKNNALMQARGANELVGVKMDYSMKNICGVNVVTVTMTATAVRTK